MDLKHLNMKALLDHILEKKQKLSTDVVIKIMDPTTTTYDMVGVLCDYINAFKLVENKADLAAFCDLSKTLEDVKNKNKLLSDKYNQCISEILDAKSKEIAIKGEKADLLIKIADLEAKNQELKRQITLMELTKL